MTHSAAKIIWDVSLCVGELDFIGTATITAHIGYDEVWTWKGGVLRYDPYVAEVVFRVSGLPDVICRAIEGMLAGMYENDRTTRELLDRLALHAHDREIDENRVEAAGAQS